jgi:hypothetical protein
MDDLIVLCRVTRPMHVDAICARICLELLQVFVEVRERMPQISASAFLAR